MDYHLECPDLCSLKPGTIWGDKATEALREGKTHRAIVALAALDKVKVDLATLSRHRKHIVLDSTPEEAADLEKPVTNIEILEKIIQKGFQNQKNWKPTISDTMKAMDMWFKLTQGNPFDELLNTLASAAIDEENPDALGLPDEEIPDFDTSG